MLAHARFIAGAVLFIAALSVPLLLFTPSVTRAVPRMNITAVKPPRTPRQRANIRGGARVSACLGELRKAGYVLGPDNVTLSDVAMTAGQLRLKPEELLRPVGANEIYVVSENSKCLRDPPVPVVFCGYVRNRAKLTVEWIQWHRVLGVQRFHIYDDDSTDGLFEALVPFIEAGVVEYHYPPEPPFMFGQHPVKGALLPAYAECAAIEAKRNVGGAWRNHSWVGFIDPDEFVFPMKGECLTTIVASTAKQAPDSIGGIALPWREVGHEGELYDNFRTQFERTHFSGGKDDRVQRIKGIVRADLPVKMDTAHFTELKNGFFTAFPTESATPVKGTVGWFTERPREVYARVRLLHYHARSLVSWLQRQLDGFADNHNKTTDYEHVEYDFNADFAKTHWMGAYRSTLEKLPPSALSANDDFISLHLRGMGFD